MEPRGPHVMSSLGIISIDELIIKGTLSPPLQGKECRNEFQKKMHICYITVLELKELISIST